MKNYYEVLQVSPTAPGEVIKSAYKAMARLYHPDSTKYDKQYAAEMMAEINEAYDILSDPVKRKKYDAERLEHVGDEAGMDRDKPKETSHFYSDVADVESEEDDADGLRGFFRSVGRDIAKGIDKNRQLVENAYLDGMSMSDYELVQQYKKEFGSRREGYGRALEDKGLMWINQEGRRVPTEDFKYLWRL